MAGLCAELGLAQPVIAWHTIGDNFADVGEVYEHLAHGNGNGSGNTQPR